ncbi:hypothetical protein MtrunA17_Chr8g0370661 [Medicago truncatula]|uniref:Uncharacterized protein n=1 Tax=Medicago truncatula TaxID=3880 RepID=A0A396GLA0_MEDTR|nr:hypothetical protein MtrunA17_Chr8g0370661 [Medicago truncatula]
MWLTSQIYLVLPILTRCIFFSVAHSIRTPQLSVLDFEQFWMGDLPGSFPVSVRVRTKRVEKTRVGLWGQSTMLKVVWDVTNGIRADLFQYDVVRGRTKRKLVGM